MSSTLALILVYLVGLVGLGLWIGRRVDSSGGFFVADRKLGAVEIRQEVYDAYNDLVDAAHEGMVWTHPGMSTYYRNSRGRVTVNSPHRNVDYYAMTRNVDLDEYRTEPRRSGD